MCPRNMCGSLLGRRTGPRMGRIFGFVLRSVKECGDSRAFDGLSAHRMGAVPELRRPGGAVKGCGVEATSGPPSRRRSGIAGAAESDVIGSRFRACELAGRGAQPDGWVVTSAAANHFLLAFG